MHTARKLNVRVPSVNSVLPRGSRVEALVKQLEDRTAAEEAARVAAEAANADLEATRQHAFELKVCN